MSDDETANFEIYGFKGPDDAGNYTCIDCGSELLGPREFVLQHYEWHLNEALKAIPDCPECHHKMAPTQGDISGVSDQGKGLVVEHAKGQWQCSNDDCDMVGIEVVVDGR